MDDDAGRWMTFAELATVRGTTKRAAVMLVRRHKWRRQRDNEGNVRALVPATWAEPVIRQAEVDRSGNGSTHSDPYTAPALATFEKALVALQEAHGRELSLLREAHAAEVAGLREATDHARAETQAAQARAEELAKEKEAWKARGRLRRAWDGWRGR